MPPAEEVQVEQEGIADVIKKHKFAVTVGVLILLFLVFRR